jgi:hypothetical protein
MARRPGLGLAAAGDVVGNSEVLSASSEMKKWRVKLLLIVAVFLSALAILFFNSGNDSKKLVEQYRNRLLAAGEDLNSDDFIPPRTDSDENGVSLFEEAVKSFPRYGDTAISSNPPIAMNIVAPGKARVMWQQSEIAHPNGRGLVTNSWEEVERDLNDQASVLGFLQLAAERPRFDFELDYHQPSLSLPHLSKIREATLLLSAKVVFDLHNGDTVSAITNFQTLFNVANAGREEPLVGSQIYRMLMMQNAMAVQWELLQATNISDAQLAGLQACWSNIDFIKPMEKAELMIRSEIGWLMNARRAGNVPGGPAGGSGGLSTTVSGGSFDIPRFLRSLRRGAGDTFWRQSWSYDDELNMLETYHVMVETMRQAETNGYFKDAFAERDRKIAALGLNRTNANWLRVHLGGQSAEFGARSVSVVASILDRVLVAEAWRQCTITAIALKRYQLRHGAFPKELGALAPEFLPAVPRDPVDGKPLRYHLNPDGTFLLYSIGADGIDDGGNGGPQALTPAMQWDSGRDWVWPQPATQQEIQNYYNHPPK